MERIMPEFRSPLPLGKAIYRALTGKSDRSEGKTTKDRTLELLAKHGGSTRKVAEAVGVSMRTVQRWKNGEQEAKNTKTRKSADALAGAQRAARVTGGRAAKFKAAATADPSGGGGAGGLSITGTIQVSEDIRERTIQPGYKIPAGELDDVIEKLAAEGPEAAAALLNRVISNYYVAGMKILSVDAIDY
jgi:transcriptional regulator with XRE-family HTH domain